MQHLTDELDPTILKQKILKKGIAKHSYLSKVSVDVSG